MTSWTCPECKRTFKRADVHQTGSLVCRAYRTSIDADEHDLVPIEDRTLRMKLSLQGLITLLPGKEPYDTATPTIEWKGGVRTEKRRMVKAQVSTTYPYAPQWALVICKALMAGASDEAESVSNKALSKYRKLEKRDQYALVSAFHIGGDKAVLSMLRELHPDLGILDFKLFDPLDEELSF